MKRLNTPVFLAALTAVAALTACGGGGGGSPSVPVVNPQPTSAPTATPAPQTASTTTGIAYLSNAYDSTKAMQVVQYEDVSGNVMATPIVQTFATADGSTLGQLVADTNYGIAGIMLEGAGSLDMSKVQEASLGGGTFTLTGSVLDMSGSAKAPLHSLTMSADGSLMLVQGADAQNYYAVGSVFSGAPAVLGAIPYPTPAPGTIAQTWNPRNLAIGPDTKSVTIRGSADTKFYSITSTPTGTGTVNYSFTLTGSIPSVASSGTLDGIGTMAYTADGAHEIFGNMSTGSDLTMVSGIPASPTAGSTITLAPTGTIHAIAVAPSGSFAAVGSGGGLFIVGGIASGSLAQAGSNYAGTFTASDGSTQSVGNVTAVGFSTDAKFIAAIVNYVLASGVAHDSLIVVPVDASGNLGAMAAHVNDVNAASGLSTDFALFR